MNNKNVQLYFIANGRLIPIDDDHKAITMPGGEPWVELHSHEIKGREILVDARVGSMDDFGILIATLSALQHIPHRKTHLFIPYFPGARGDRVNFGDGTALTAKMYADIINSYSLDTVHIVDPHSDVTPALINNVRVHSMADVIVSERKAFSTKYDAIVCPDQGAEKRTELAAKALGVNRIIHGRKKRDLSTGVLTGFEIQEDSVVAPDTWTTHLLVVDDICDGGGTFVGLLEALQQKVRSSEDKLVVDLFVTHGIFSKGLKVLAGFDNVMSTDSFPWTTGTHSSVKYGSLPLISKFHYRILEWI